MKTKRKLPQMQTAICSMYVSYQAIPGESPNTIPTNMCVVGSNGARTNQLMFYVPSRAYEKVLWWFLDLNQFVSN